MSDSARSVFDIALQQCNLGGSQIEQFVDAGIDVGFGVGQLLGEGLHGGTLLGEVGFPLVGSLWFLELSESGRPSSRVGQARFERRPTTAHLLPTSSAKPFSVTRRASDARQKRSMSISPHWNSKRCLAPWPLCDSSPTTFEAGQFFVERHCARSSERRQHELGSCRYQFVHVYHVRF